MQLNLATEIILSLVYGFLMYILTKRVYDKKGLKITKTDLIIRSIFAGGMFFVLLIILGGLN